MHAALSIQLGLAFQRNLIRERSVDKCLPKSIPPILARLLSRFIAFEQSLFLLAKDPPIDNNA